MPAAPAPPPCLSLPPACRCPQERRSNASTIVQQDVRCVARCVALLSIRYDQHWQQALVHFLGVKPSTGLLQAAGHHNNSTFSSLHYCWPQIHMISSVCVSCAQLHAPDVRWTDRQTCLYSQLPTWALPCAEAAGNSDVRIVTLSMLV